MASLQHARESKSSDSSGPAAGVTPPRGNANRGNAFALQMLEAARGMGEVEEANFLGAGEMDGMSGVYDEAENAAINESEMKLAEENAQSLRRQAQGKEAEACNEEELRGADGEFETRQRSAMQGRRAVLDGPEGPVEVPATHRTYEFLAHDVAYRDFSEMSDAEREATRRQVESMGYRIVSIRTHDDTGFQSVAFAPLEGTGHKPVLAFRGTANVKGALTDMDPEGVGETQYQANRHGIEVDLQTLAEMSGQKAVTTGHSLGGALSQRTAVDMGDLIDEVVTYQGAGIQEGLRDRWNLEHGAEASPADRHRATHYIGQEDIVHQTGKHLFGRTIEAETKGEVAAAGEGAPGLFDLIASHAAPHLHALGSAAVHSDAVGAHRAMGLTHGAMPLTERVTHPSDKPANAWVEEGRAAAGTLKEGYDEIMGE